MTTLIDLEVIDEVNKAMESVPFGNSCFQNKHLTDGHETPQRRKRVILLQLNAKIEALQMARFSRDRLMLDLEELDVKIAAEFGIAKKRLEIDVTEKKWNLQRQEKLLQDAMIEVIEFYKELKTLPDFTRAEFENAELDYWEKRFVGDAQRQISCTGTVNPDLLKELNKIDLHIKIENGQGLIVKQSKEQICG